MNPHLSPEKIRVFITTLESTPLMVGSFIFVVWEISVFLFFQPSINFVMSQMIQEITGAIFFTKMTVALCTSPTRQPGN